MSATATSHVVTIEEAAAMLGVGRSTAYSAVKAGEFPVPVIKVGRRLLVSRHRLEELLGLPNDVEPAGNRFDGKVRDDGAQHTP